MAKDIGDTDSPPLYDPPPGDPPIATYYVDGVDGNDGNLGTSEGSGNAWATIGQAVSSVAAGDKVYIKANTTYTENLTLSTVGATNNPIVWEGYTTTPGDGGVVTIRSGSTTADVLAAGSGNWYNVFKNIAFRGAAGSTTGQGVNVPIGARLFFINCRAYEHGRHGFEVAQNSAFYSCYAHDNGNDGFSSQSTSLVTCVGCVSEGNTNYGFGLGPSQVIGCISSGNGLGGVLLQGSGNYLIMNCTVDGNGKTTVTGIDVSGGSSSAIAVVNCIVYDCQTGISGPAGAGERIFSRNNLVNNNTTNYSNFATYAGEVTSAPNFVAEASLDYGLQASSPAKGAGFSVKTPNWVSQTGDDYDIGAVKAQASGGGGGGRTGIMTGGML